MLVDLPGKGRNPDVSIYRRFRIKNNYIYTRLQRAESNDSGESIAPEVQSLYRSYPVPE